MHSIFPLHLVVCCTCVLAASPAQRHDRFNPDELALSQTTAKMAPRPTAFAPPITNRAAWSVAAARANRQDILERAAEAVRTPMPELTDELYLDFSRTGNRRRCEAVFFARRTRIGLFTLAECLEAQGRFLSPLEAAIRAVCAERSWVMPAHDGNLDNFNGRAVTIDLAVAMLAWDLATADNILGDALSAATRQLIRQELNRRVFEPYRRMTSGQQDAYWLAFVHNWNAVCLAGVTGAALAILEDPKERAWFALAAEVYSRNFLRGFSPDGYCSEGVSYWNYGFGHYVGLTEAVRLATGGALDLLDRSEAVLPAVYAFQIEITGGVCPAFADCPVDARPDPRLLDYLGRRLGVGGPVDRKDSPVTGYSYLSLMRLFPDPAPVLSFDIPMPPLRAPRTWFGDAGIFIGRPSSPGGLGVAFKGGHNAEHHNHNDVGTFIVVVNGQTVLPDIGAEVYTQRTFSSRRYESQALNSFGHAVPVVAGRLQRTGAAAAARVLDTDFEDDPDAVTFDIRPAYDVPSLERLNRTFVYARAAGGSFTVRDEFAFREPATYETALLTFGQWEHEAPDVLRVRDRSEGVIVQVTAPPGAALEIVSERIREDLTARRVPTRIGLRLKEPIRAGAFTMVITPESGR